MNNFKNIIQYSAIGLFAVCVYALILLHQYGSAIAMAGIFISIFIPFITKDIELEKHRQQLLFEKKYNAYSRYFEIFDDFYHSSSEVVVEISQFNKKQHKNEEEFEKHKQKLLEALEKFFTVKKYLSMPGLEILIFVNEKIGKKIEEITSLNYNIVTEAPLEENERSIKIYIKILSELAVLLQEDLKIKI